MYPTRPAYDIADFHEVVDVADREKTLAVAARYQIDGILSDTSDVGVPTAAYVAERLGLPGLGFEAALNFSNKARMRERVAKAGLVTPRFQIVRSKQDVCSALLSIGMPAVLKPVDNQSGRGVSIVVEPAQLEAALNYALANSRQGLALIEEALQGTELIVDSFAVAGVVHVLGIARKVPYLDNRTVSSRIAYPADLSPELIARAKLVNARTLVALGLMSGVSHAEYMVVGSEIVPLDVAARGGGVRIYTHVLPHVSGIDANRAMISYAMGRVLTISPAAEFKAATIDFFRMPAGKLIALEGVERAAAIPGIAAVHLNVHVGDVIGALHDKDDRPGFVVALGETLTQAVERARAAVNCIQVRIAGRNCLESVTREDSQP
jgi:carbamoyl-phosphate synthase large subunit